MCLFRSASVGPIPARRRERPARVRPHRPTHDLDFFASPDTIDATAAADQFERAVAERGWHTERLHDTPTFVRFHISGNNDLILEFAIDSAARLPPVISIAGPTFDPEELAGRKLIAFANRAEARDFTDVHAFAQRFGRATLLQRSHDIDPGFDRAVLAEMLSTLTRFVDAELPIDITDTAAVRSFFADWAHDLEQGD
jgi:hypothetical protein